MNFDWTAFALYVFNGCRIADMHTYCGHNADEHKMFTVLKQFISV